MFLSLTLMSYNSEPNQYFATWKKANNKRFYRLLSFAFCQMKHKIYIVAILTKLQENKMISISIRKLVIGKIIGYLQKNNSISSEKSLLRILGFIF